MQIKVKFCPEQFGILVYLKDSKMLLFREFPFRSGLADVVPFIASERTKNSAMPLKPRLQQ
jgi:hypothetical protein